MVWTRCLTTLLTTIWLYQSRMCSSQLTSPEFGLPHTTSPDVPDFETSHVICPNSTCIACLAACRHQILCVQNLRWVSCMLCCCCHLTSEKMMLNLLQELCHIISHPFSYQARASSFLQCLDRLMSVTMWQLAPSVILALPIWNDCSSGVSYASPVVVLNICLVHRAVHPLRGDHLLFIVWCFYMSKCKQRQWYKYQKWQVETTSNGGCACTQCYVNRKQPRSVFLGGTGSCSCMCGFRWVQCVF